MTWSRVTAITGSAVVTLASCRIRIVRGHREPPRNCGTMAPGAGRRDERSSVTFNSVPDAGEQLKACGYDDHPSVGNLIGYSYRYRITKGGPSSRKWKLIKCLERDFRYGPDAAGSAP